MAIPAVNAIYHGFGGTSAEPIGPTVSGEVLASAYGGNQSQLVSGFVLPVLDGSLTTFTLNWIDGVATLPTPPQAVFLYRQDPPAWTASTVYPKNYVVLGSGHVQQVTTAGKSSSAAPTWKTDGTSVTETSGPTWKDLGAIALSTISAVTVTAITNLAATVTISAAGTNTNIPVISFFYIL